MALNVLIVEDSPIMRKVIERTFNICGFGKTTIFEAVNGKEGLSILEEQKVDILLIDINMPVMDGLKMLKEVRGREKLKGIPALVVSAESNDKRIKEVTEYGATFIHKPFTPEKLKDEILHLSKRENIEISDTII